MTAYASGQWNPHRTPYPPRPVLESPLRSVQNASSRLPKSPSSLLKPMPLVHTVSDSFLSGRAVVSSPVADAAARTDDFHKAQGSSALPSDKLFSKLTSPGPSLMGRRFRKSFNDIRHPTGGQPLHLSLDSTQNMNFSSDATTAAATMRVAAARVNISPLALPSPEHELTDPMRGVHAAIPGSHPPNCSPPVSQGTPGSGRKTRLGSFWEGTQDIGEDTERLPTILGSDPGSPLRSEVDETTSNAQSVDHPPSSLPPQPATAPISRSPGVNTDEDYFTVASTRTNSIDAHPRGPVLEVPSQWQEYVNLRRDTEPIDPNVTTVPALPRRICLTRQTSSPLPEIRARDKILPGGRSVSDTISSYRIGRAAKEEHMFSELGYLAPPNPPDELERRRALYKCVVCIPVFITVAMERCVGSIFGTPPLTSTSTGLHIWSSSYSTRSLS